PVAEEAPHVDHLPARLDRAGRARVRRAGAPPCRPAGLPPDRPRLPPMTAAPREPGLVYVSYSRENEEAVRAVVERLQRSLDRRGIQGWVGKGGLELRRNTEHPRCRL